MKPEKNKDSRDFEVKFFSHDLLKLSKSLEVNLVLAIRRSLKPHRHLGPVLNNRG